MRDEQAENMHFVLAVVHVWCRLSDRVLCADGLLKCAQCLQAARCAGHCVRLSHNLLDVLRPDVLHTCRHAVVCTADLKVRAPTILQYP